MTNAFVLMTALPPTYGHLDLIQFATNLNVSEVTVLLNTQPDEPLIEERFHALETAAERLDNGFKVTVKLQNEYVQQEATGPEDQAFWDDWVYNLRRYGFETGDYIVASEAYGVRLAKEAGGKFMVYDRDRWVRFTKGTNARNDYIGNWSTILPEFRRALQTKVTIFGAESTGKTTLTVALADEFADRKVGATTLFEWARPFLELAGPEVTNEAMVDIWRGQYALQESTYQNALNPLIIQDTDLWTTIGFWEDWDRTPGAVPDGLYVDAAFTPSDLYIILRSNIPFEPDILRTGGDKRETTDFYWVDICERYGLNYVVLDADVLEDRVLEAAGHIEELLVSQLTYKRVGAEYE